MPGKGQFSSIMMGKVFGRLTIVAEEERRAAEPYVRYFTCLCVCGKIAKGVHMGSLRSGRTKSCGCIAFKRGRVGLGDRLRDKSEYKIWLHMRYRCNSPSCHAYPTYGGRGIFVVSRWDDFRTFLEDMGRRPSMEHSLDRIDNDGPYSPENCRWATHKEQQANKRGLRYIEHNGERLVLAEWARRIGIGPTALSARLKRMPVAQALTQGRQFQRHHAHQMIPDDFSK